MKKFNKIKMSIGIAMVAAMMISNTALAKTNVDYKNHHSISSSKSKNKKNHKNKYGIEMPDLTSEAEFIEDNYIDYFNKRHEPHYDEAFIYDLDKQDVFTPGVFRDCYLQIFVAQEFFTYDLATLNKYHLGKLTVGGKTFTEGFYAVQWVDAFESCVVECNEDDFKDIAKNLNPKYWVELNDHKYETVHKEGEPFYSVYYDAKYGILTVSIHKSSDGRTDFFSYSIGDEEYVDEWWDYYFDKFK